MTGGVAPRGAGRLWHRKLLSTLLVSGGAGENLDRDPRAPRTCLFPPLSRTLARSRRRGDARLWPFAAAELLGAAPPRTARHLPLCSRRLQRRTRYLREPSPPRMVSGERTMPDGHGGGSGWRRCKSASQIMAATKNYWIAWDEVVTFSVHCACAVFDKMPKPKTMFAKGCSSTCCCLEPWGFEEYSWSPCSGWLMLGFLVTSLIWTWNTSAKSIAGVGLSDAGHNHGLGSGARRGEHD